MLDFLKLLTDDPTLIIVLLSFIFALISFVVSLLKAKTGDMSDVSKNFDDLKNATSLLASGMRFLLDKEKHNNEKKENE